MKLFSDSTEQGSSSALVMDCRSNPHPEMKGSWWMSIIAPADIDTAAIATSRQLGGLLFPELNFRVDCRRGSSITKVLHDYETRQKKKKKADNENGNDDVILGCFGGECGLSVSDGSDRLMDGHAVSMGGS